MYFRLYVLNNELNVNGFWYIFCLKSWTPSTPTKYFLTKRNGRSASACPKHLSVEALSHSSLAKSYQRVDLLKWLRNKLPSSLAKLFKTLARGKPLANLPSSKSAPLFAIRSRLCVPVRLFWMVKSNASVCSSILFMALNLYRFPNINLEP